MQREYLYLNGQRLAIAPNEQPGDSADYADVLQGFGPSTYLRLGETSATTAFDQTLNSHDGTYSGDFTLGAVGGTLDSDPALSLSGAGYVDVAQHDDLIAFGTGDFAVTLLFYSNQVVSDPQVMVAYTTRGASSTDLWLLYIEGGGVNKLSWQVGEGDVHAKNILGDTSVAADNRWHHVVGQRVNGVLEMWVDGVKQSQTLAHGVHLSQWANT
ncbi:MAG: LamG-like jellyroll fold domain-containing protein, partial [Gammaproteobacteria bacterium]